MSCQSEIRNKEEEMIISALADLHENENIREFIKKYMKPSETKLKRLSDKKINELEKKTMQDGFWNDQKESKKILSEIKSRKGKVTKYKTLSKEIDDTKELIDIVTKQKQLLLESGVKTLDLFLDFSNIVTAKSEVLTSLN